MKIAAAAYPLTWFDHWSDYERKVTEWVTEAARNAAQLLVFPEYGAMELASLAGSDDAANLEKAVRAAADRMEQAADLHQALAARHGVHILAASGPLWEGKRPVNAARLFAPGGGMARQDKQIMTRFEREVWDVVPGGPLHVIDTALGRIAILICYDAEFPLLARAVIEAGAELLLVPSCTDTAAGYARVRTGAMARALEGQCVVVHSATVGPAPWCPAVDINVGAAAIYGPPDLGFPSSGVIAEGRVDEPGWVYAEIDTAAISRVRREGHVLNHAHWPEQFRRVASVKMTSTR